MSRRLPPLNALRAFEAAARHLSFLKAAEELHVTAGAISQQIKTLEDHLSLKLFRRQARGVLLTDAGQLYGKRIGELLDQIAVATRDLGRQMMERGAVHASSPLMARLIGEIVARFGITISDRLGASFVPVIGAIGGATVNMIFMDHFQRVARGHFTVRRLERAYGADQIRRYYEAAADAVAGRPAPAKAQ